MEALRQELSGFRYKGVVAIALIFALISAVLFAERSGIQYQYNKPSISLLPQDQVVTKEEALVGQETHTLVLWDRENANSVQAYEQFQVILSDMKLGYRTCDLAREEEFELEPYELVIVLLSDLTPLGQRVLELCDYVYEGGSVLFPVTLEKTVYSAVIEQKMGIIDSSYDHALVQSIYVEEDFMIGGGRSFQIDDPFDSGQAVQLDSARTVVHAYTDDERRLPLIWETTYGAGKFIVDNFGFYTKEMRGFFAASLSLAGDVFVYPVINGSVFYLDDFPSQIPSGNSAYIQRDYGISIRDFYVNIWWPDMMNIGEKYGLRYTGLAIECYDDAVDGRTGAAPDKGTFLNFGNMLLRMGGEIGYHGYNHQPLVLGNRSYHGVYDYKTWESETAMGQAFDALVELCDELFPGVDLQLYVPPSNLLSEEGEAFLKKEYPNIKTISGIYFDDEGTGLDFSCTQEFEVDGKGVVHQPRIISGCDVTDYMKLAAISELNFHFVNSHFTHPDDALDVDRGAELGWEELKARFCSYLDWLYSAAPNLRNFTGSELSAAVERFVALQVKKEMGDGRMTLTLGNFRDEAQLMVRFNDKHPSRVEGGSLTHMTGDLYLLEADRDRITVYFE